MNEIVVATRNKKKLIELQRLLEDIDVKPLSLDEFKETPEVEEDGDTFHANAQKINGRDNKQKLQYFFIFPLSPHQNDTGHHK